MPPPPGLTTRREFLERSAAAAALLALPWAAGCASGSDRRIVRAAIHPTIGVARVGNSPDSFFFGPEVPGALPRASGGFKDGNGAVAKQAARFRVYGLDADGRPVRELTAAEADITWRVSVANTKAAWYDFSVAYDLPDAAPAALRNPDVAKRERLVVFPGERSVHGAGARPVPLHGVVSRRRRRSRGADDRRGRPPRPPPRSRPGVLEGQPSTDDLLRQRRLDGRRLRRPRPRNRPHRRPHDRGGAGLGAGHAAELRAGDVDRPRHAVRRGAVDVRRVGRARPRRGQLRRRHPPDLRAHDRDAVGERGLLPQQRLREQGGLADRRERRAARRPRRAHVPSRAVQAVPQPGLPDRPARSDSGHVRRPRQHPAGERPAVAHGHAAPVRAPRRVGGRPLRRRSRPRVHRPARPREPAAGGAGARARPRGPRVLPRRRIPPRNRGAVDAADRDACGSARSGCACARPSRRSTTARC